MRLVATTFNERFTLDRQPLNAAQQTENPAAGPYRRGPGTVASYLYPLVDGADKLMQSNCFWSANDAGVGDDLLLNWEGVLHLDPSFGGDSDVHLMPENNQVSMCRFNHPITRQPPQFSEGEFDSSNVNYYQGRSALDGVFPVIGLDQLELGEDNTSVFSPHLTAQPHPNADWNNSCQSGDAIIGAIDVTNGVQGYDGQSTDNGYVSGCSGQGRRIRPGIDADWLVEMRPRPMDDAFTRLALAGIKTASSGDKLSRAATVAADGQVLWQTPETGNLQDPAQGRWLENFSSSIRVSQVRLLRRSNGQSAYLSLEEFVQADVCIRRSADVNSCHWVCPMTAGTQGEAVIEPLSGCRNGAGDLAVASLTPTMDLDLLAASPGPVTRPLVWQAHPESPTNVYFEFTLVNQFSPIALRMDELILFGQVPPDIEPVKFMSVWNSGYRPVQIISVEKGIDSQHANEFALQTFSETTAVPTGLVQSGDGNLGTVKLAEDYQNFPNPELAISDNLILLGQPSPQEQSLTVDGIQLTYQHGVLQGYDLENAFTLQRSGYRHFFTVPARTPASLPLILSPGENIELGITLQPTGPGQKFATVRVQFVDPATPGNIHQIAASVSAEVLAGAAPATIPDQVLLNDDPASGHLLRNFAVINNGDQDLWVENLWLVGQDADRFELSGQFQGRTLAPGEMAMDHIRYLTTCESSGQVVEHQTLLIIDTDVRELLLPVRGISRHCWPNSH